MIFFAYIARYFVMLYERCVSDKNEIGRGGRVVEGARLESVWAPKGPRGFESRPLRKIYQPVNY